MDSQRKRKAGREETDEMKEVKIKRGQDRDIMVRRK